MWKQHSGSRWSGQGSSGHSSFSGPHGHRQEPCSLGTTQGLSSLHPSLCRTRQSSLEAPWPHTGSATEEQRLFRQGWFPDDVDITPLQCVAVPLERGGYLEKPYHRSPISHLREVLCSLLLTKEGISLDA